MLSLFLKKFVTIKVIIVTIENLESRKKPIVYHFNMTTVKFLKYFYVRHAAFTE